MRWRLQFSGNPIRCVDGIACTGESVRGHPRGLQSRRWADTFLHLALVVEKGQPQLMPPVEALVGGRLAPLRRDSLLSSFQGQRLPATASHPHAMAVPPMCRGQIMCAGPESLPVSRGTPPVRWVWRGVHKEISACPSPETESLACRVGAPSRPSTGRGA